MPDDLRERLQALEPDNLGDEILRDQALDTLDLIQQLQEDIDSAGVRVPGPPGREVANPSVAAIGNQRRTLALLLARLFPAEDSAGQRQARRAANARWRRGA